MTEFVQFLVLAFTALVWWLAKRDLTARASRLRAASAAEVDELKETVEALTAALEARVTTEEKRLSALIAEARLLQSPLVSPAPSAPAAVISPTVAIEEPAVKPVAPTAVEAPKELAAETVPAFAAPEPPIEEEPSEAVLADDLLAASDAAPEEAPVAPETRETSTLHQQVLEAERRAALVRAQLAIGVTDPIEIVRRTGLPRGEVELLIGLRSLRIEPAAPMEASAPPAKEVESAKAPEPTVHETASSPPPAENDRYAAIYAMLASGITDSTEIARRTGMGRGEVELILGLRARNL